MKANTKNAYAVGMRWSTYDDAKRKAKSLDELHRLSYSVSVGRRCPVYEAVRRACLGVSLREAVSDISVEYGLTDSEAEWVETQADDELADLQRMGRFHDVG